MRLASAAAPVISALPSPSRYVVGGGRAALHTAAAMMAIAIYGDDDGRV